MYALAIDLGTTTLAVSLLHLESARRMSIAGAINPQRSFGADVISRLGAAVNSDAAFEQMTALVRAELWRLCLLVCNQAGLERGQISEIALAGNPAMQHIFLGLPVKTLASPPFRPLFTHGHRISAAAIGWATAADLYVLPMPGGFIGGDMVAFLFGQAGGGQTDGASRLYLDMGTNGEMALTAGETVWTTSAAAGPAFEGGNLNCGMPALPGAIDSLRIVDDRVRHSVIGGLSPVGICGSAAIQAVVELLAHGLLEPSGRLRDSTEIPSNLAERLVRHRDENAFVLHRDARCQLLLTQEDIRQIQLAKGALRAGLEVLAERSRIHCQALQEVVLTGSFGAVLQAEWLKSIGIFDPAMVHITRFAPEGALAGVERALALQDGFASVEDLAARFRVVPLSGTPLFETKFFNNIDFPHS